MTYDEYKNKIGTRYTFVQGEIVEDADGEVVVSNTPKLNTIYLNNRDRTATLMVDPKLYVGRRWKLFTSDCVSVAAEYLDDHIGTSLKRVRPRREYDKYFKEGMCQWFEDHGFKEVAIADMQPNDVLVFDYDEGIITHVCVYLGDGKVLHHMSNKYSSIDPLGDVDSVLGVYRYAD